MVRVRFYLERRKDKQTGAVRVKGVPIVGHAHYSSRIFVFFTGERIDAKFWDKKEQRVKGGVAGRAQINDNLETQAEKIRKSYKEALTSGTPIDNDLFRNCLNEKLAIASTKKCGFFELWDQYLITRVNQYSKSFTKSLGSARNHFGNFCKMNKISPTFESIDLRMLEGFRDYLVEKCNAQCSTVATNVSRLKFFLVHSHKAGLHNNLSFKNFTVSSHDSEIYFLTWDELMKLYEFQFPRMSLEQVRDAYCFASFTGLRYSDLRNLKNSDIDGDFIRFKTIKTKESNSIPLTEMAKDILKKYADYPGNSALPVISNQKMNERLKVLCKMAGLNSPVTRVKFIGSKRIEKTVPKYSVITAHTARKNFIANALRFGMSSEVIRSISGHKSTKAFSRYYKILDDHKRNELLKYFGNGDSTKLK